MATHGKNGHVTAATTDLDINDWNYEHGPNEVVEYPNQDGEAETEPGYETGSGSFTVRVAADVFVETIMPSGSLVALTLEHINGGIAHAGQGRIGKKSFSVNRLSGIQTVSIAFTQHGTWTHPAA